jgi:hypothetical protein
LRSALLALLLLAPLASAYPDKDAWSFLVSARTRIREGENLLRRSSAAATLLGRRQYALRAVAKFESATEVSNRGLQVADASLQDALFLAWSKAKQLAAQADPPALPKKAKPNKNKKSEKKKRDGGSGGGSDPQTTSGSYGIAACARINARRRAIGAPPLCRRGLMR